MPTNYYLQIKPQIHQILEASEAMMDMQFDPSQSTRTFVLSSVMTEISVVISGVLPKMIERSSFAAGERTGKTLGFPKSLFCGYRKRRRFV